MAHRGKDLHFSECWELFQCMSCIEADTVMDRTCWGGGGGMCYNRQGFGTKQV